MLRILILLVSGVFCSSALSSQDLEEATLEEIPASELNVVIDVVYGHDFGMAMTFDIYLPPKPNGAGIILINSGGWRSPADTFKVLDGGFYRFATSEEMFETNTWHILNPQLLVSKGFTVFEVRHGSRPKFEMKELVPQVRRAVRFIKHHASEYGVDPARIGLWGGSASGHLALLIGMSPEIGLEDVNQEWEKKPATVAAIVAFASPSDLAIFVTNNPEARKLVQAVRLTQEQYREYSPVTYVTSDDPPILIMHGNKDEAVPIVQGELIFKELQSTGVESVFIEFDNTSHSPTLEQAERGVTAALKWFEKYLLP